MLLPFFFTSRQAWGFIKIRPLDLLKIIINYLFIARTCVAGFLYLMLVVPGNWAAILSSSTEPSSSTDTWGGNNKEIK